MDSDFTPGATRALQLAEEIARQLDARAVEPVHLLWALVSDESRAAEVLGAHGISADELRRRLPLPLKPAGESIADAPPIQSDELRAVVLEAQRRGMASGTIVEIGSEHLLCGLVEIDSPVRALLHEQGLRSEQAAAGAARQNDVSTEPLSTDIRLEFPAATATDATDTYRILDAAANRAREGLRVLEDYARFALDDKHLTTLLKNARHRLAEALSLIDGHALISSRDTPRDVGTGIHTRREELRESIVDVLRANCKRTQEALRTLEEFGKTLSSAVGQQLGQIRYEIYTLEKALLQTHSARERLAGRVLYVLVSEEFCPRGAGPVIRGALAGGAGIIQVREKNMPDRELVAHGKRVREWTAAAGALFIMNDRPDLAVLTEADGVHVGQEELSVREARRIVGPGKLIGVSTHTLEQARQALLDGADYIGVGPVFASGTKQFESLAGLDFVRQVAAEITLPAFAIGGITLDNLDDALAAGAQRVAVSGAICGAENPEQAAQSLIRRLVSARTG